MGRTLHPWQAGEADPAGDGPAAPVPRLQCEFPLAVLVGEAGADGGDQSLDRQADV